MKEVWKSTAYLGYMVSNRGRVRNKYGRIIGSPRNDGYSGVAIRVAGQRIDLLVHVLVCEAFHEPKPTIDHEVNHKDLNRSNNNHWNLEWITSTGNHQHARANGRAGSNSAGERHHRAKLSNKQVRKIYFLHNVLGWSMPRIAYRYGVGISCIWKILHHKRRSVPT